MIENCKNVSLKIPSFGNCVNWFSMKNRKMKVIEKLKKKKKRDFQINLFHKSLCRNISSSYPTEKNKLMKNKGFLFVILVIWQH